MNQNQEGGAPQPAAARRLQPPRQLTLGLFPGAPGRPPAAAAFEASNSPRLRQTERAGDSQRSLPIRPLIER